MALIYVDANVFITAFEAEPSIAAACRALFVAGQSKPFHLVTSELTIGEVLAPSSAPGSLTVERKLEIYQTILLWSEFVRLIPVTRNILLRTASLRAAHRQKLPDAIHAVTALQSQCKFFCSADGDDRRLPSNLTLLVPDQTGFARLREALAE